MADKRAEIVFIGEIETHFKGRKLVIKLQSNMDGRKSYVIYENEIHKFDLVRKFERGDFKVGDTIEFDYNEPTGNWFPNIWRISNHRKKGD